MLTRVLQTAQVTLSHTFYLDGVATDAAGNVTVTISRLDGTLVNSGTAAHPSTGTYTYSPPASATLDAWTVDWSGVVGGVTVVARDFVEVVGGFFFSTSAVRSMKPALSSALYPDTLLAAKRTFVEQECEDICGTAFVPRFRRIKVNGDGGNVVLLPRPPIRSIRAVIIDGVAMSQQSLGNIWVGEEGVIESRGPVFSYGRGNVVIEYEHGSDHAPDSISEAGKLRLRARQVLDADTLASPQASSYTTPTGGVYQPTGPTGEKVGMKEVDGVYERHTLAVGGWA